jgi:hypothetical protein
MGSFYNGVGGNVHFLTPGEGGRSRNVDVRNLRSPYDLLADLGLDQTEHGFPIRC